MDLASILQSEGQSAAIVAILQTLPMPKLMMIFLCLVCFVYLATTIDSCAYVLAGTTMKRLKGDEEPARWNRIFWAILFCLLSIGLMLIGGPGGSEDHFRTHRAAADRGVDLIDHFSKEDAYRGR